MKPSSLNKSVTRLSLTLYSTLVFLFQWIPKSSQFKKGFELLLLHTHPWGGHIRTRFRDSGLQTKIVPPDNIQTEDSGLWILTSGRTICWDHFVFELTFSTFRDSFRLKRDIFVWPLLLQMNFAF